VQDNHSRSARGTVRGIHYQDTSAPMAKLVRCTAGTVLDAAVDLRLGSPRFGQWVAVELTAETMKQLFVPVGYGHAFQALTEGAEVQYRCTGAYAPAAEGAVRWDDPELAMPWPIAEALLSPKDAVAQSLAEYRARPAFRFERPFPPPSPPAR
jgi:dTDP-4-dehydrorhamnose 3,5-epimerase